MTVPVSPGDVIDGTYVLERLLGEGGMGAVFIAHEERLGRRVAIKVLLSEVANTPEAVTRFEREARSAAALQSDHVTRVLSVGHLSSGAPYIVMELLEGEDLAATLASRGPLPVHEVVGFMMPVCEALSEAHALGIVHRDLKPANVFLARRPTGGTRVKVLDFGISKSATGTASKSLTAAATLMGTPPYMSPEQLREAHNVDGRADIWALGVMMYELLSGKTPFVSDALAELCVLIMTTPHVPLIRLRPDIPPELDAIVNRCLQKDPADRFATAHELMAALATVPLHGSPPAARPPPPPRMATPRMNPIAALPTELAARAQAPTQPIGLSPPPVYAPSRFEPAAVPAATVDAVSTTQPWLPPTRPNTLGLVLVFAAALAIGGAVFYALVLKPTPSQEGDTAAAVSASSADGAKGAAAGASSGLATSDSATGASIASSPASSASAPRPTTPSASQAITPKPSRPSVVLLPPPATLPPPTAVPQAAVVRPPAVAASAAPTARVAPSAKPTATPPSNPGSLMPGARN